MGEIRQGKVTRREIPNSFSESLEWTQKLDAFLLGGFPALHSHSSNSMTESSYE